MRCEKCGHDEYLATTNTTTNDTTYQFTVPVSFTIGSSTTYTPQTQTFVVGTNCSCCENRHEETKK